MKAYINNITVVGTPEEIVQYIKLSNKSLQYKLYVKWDKYQSKDGEVEKILEQFWNTARIQNHKI